VIAKNIEIRFWDVRSVSLAAAQLLPRSGS
jgi:hypothetical protein